MKSLEIFRLCFHLLRCVVVDRRSNDNASGNVWWIWWRCNGVGAEAQQWSAG